MNVEPNPQLSHVERVVGVNSHAPMTADEARALEVVLFEPHRKADAYWSYCISIWPANADKPEQLILNAPFSHNERASKLLEDFVESCRIARQSIDQRFLIEPELPRGFQPRQRSDI